MTTNNVDYASPTAQFTYDLNNNVVFKRDNQNYFSGLTINQLNTLGNTSVLDIYLSNGGIVEPHIHQNTAEVVFCIAGTAVVSFINPFTNELHNFTICASQVVNIPQGWWHYIIATVDGTHLLAIFEVSAPDTIFGSDILRLTPSNVLAYTYCLDPVAIKQALAPLTNTVAIGPPITCNKMHPQAKQSTFQQGHGYHQQYTQQPYQR